MNWLHNLAEIPSHARGDAKLQVLSGKQVMMFWSECAAGGHTPRHAHIHEQITWLLEGRMKFQFGDEPEVVCEPGAIILVPSNIPHEAWYLDHCKVVEVFNPPRLDLFPAASMHPYAVSETADGTTQRK